MAPEPEVPRFSSVLSEWGVSAEDFPHTISGELVAITETVFAPRRHQARVVVAIYDGRFQLVDELLEVDEGKKVSRLVILHALGSVNSQIDGNGDEIMVYEPTAALARVIERDFFTDEVDEERLVRADMLPQFSCLVRRAADRDALGDNARTWDDHTVWDFSRCAPTLDLSTRRIEWTKSLLLNQRIE